MDRPEKMRRKMRKVEMSQTPDKKRGVFVFVGFFMWTIFKVSVEFVTTLLLFSALIFLPTRHVGS